MSVEVTLPQLGESVHEGTIGKWLKAEGDQVTEYEPLLEVVTDKVDTEVTAPGSGTLLKVLVPEGETVAVGTLLAVIGAPGEDVSAAARAAPSAPAEAAPAPADSSEEAHAPADSRKATPATADSSKSPAPAHSSESAAGAATSGTDGTASDRARRVSPVAARVAAGHGVDVSLVPGTGRGGSVTKEDVEKYLAGQKAHEATGAGAPPGFISPRVARLSAELGVNLGQVTGTGSGGRITARDVEAFAKAPMPAQPGMPAAPAPESAPLSGPSTAPPSAPSTAPAAKTASPVSSGLLGELVQLTPIRKSIAEHMVRSKNTSPHVGTVHEVDMGAVMHAYKAMKGAYADSGVRLTLTAFIVQAAAEALVEHPMVNSSWTDDGILIHADVNIGLAVAIPTGLIVPVIHNAGEKSLRGLAREVTDLATRARDKKLTPDDVHGGTFTITNYGTLGSLFGTPVINQPQAAILGTGAIKKRPVVIEGPDGDSIGIRPMMFLALTFDHRILDGGTADPFVETIVGKLENYTVT